MAKRSIKKFFGIKILRKSFHSSDLGYFSETYRDSWLKREFVQDSISMSKKKGTIRGLHLQKGNKAQAKLISVLKGSIQDYFVDLRPNSKTFGDYGSIKLDEKNNLCLFIPQGFAHGFISLKTNTIVNYKLDNYYSPKDETTILWNDPDISIKWPKELNYTLSQKDEEGISLKKYLSELN
tara:strand:+ start:37223 stop:37762 length:540 start_codon:yes stop_codon:yes gene_type:complete